MEVDVPAAVLVVPSEELLYLLHSGDGLFLSLFNQNERRLNSTRTKTVYHR